MIGNLLEVARHADVALCFGQALLPATAEQIAVLVLAGQLQHLEEQRTALVVAGLTAVQ